jgi:hypothetical protein
MCEGCHRITPTVHGKCPNCWFEKEPSAIPATRRYKAFLWDDFFDPEHLL